MDEFRRRGPKQNMNIDCISREMTHTMYLPLIRAKFAKSFANYGSLAIAVAATVLFLSVPVAAEDVAGTLGGVTHDSASGRALAGARIIAHNLNRGTEITTDSDADGNFTLTDLEPGSYQLTAAKNGFQSWSKRIELAQATSARIDLTLVAVRVDQPANLSVAAPAEVTPSLVKELEAMRQRIEQLEAELKTRHEEPAKTTIQSPGTVLIATATRDGGEISPLPGNLRKPGDRDLLGDNVPSGVPALPHPTAAPVTTPVQQVAPPDSVPATKGPIDPFSDADWTWLNGNSRQKDSPLDSKYFTGEFRADAYYGVDFNQPRDHTMGGSSELFRSGELQLEDLSIGGDFHVDNVRGRVLLLDGMFAATTPRNDASSAVGQWDVRGAYKYVSEAWGGYHWNVNHGLNVDAGIFVSYVGLFSYHNFDNWAYQPSYVSSNTPWFFNGVRVQWFPTAHLKIEPWFINGWQSYNKFNSHPGLGGQIKWAPKPWLLVIGNQYGFGEDTLGNQTRQRYHTDDSVEVKYYDRPAKTIDKAAFTFTGDLGCESGGGVTCHGGKAGPKQAFLGFMVYNRVWFKKDLYAVTLGGGAINNPGRYLTLVLPINGADAVSGTPYFPQNPGSQFKAYDATATFDYMPKQYFTWRLEFGYRHANVPYFSGRGGSTPPLGNNGDPSAYVCNDGAASATTSGCGSDGGLWSPDLRKGQALLMMAFLIKF
jgi:hypothetical protein